MFPNEPTFLFIYSAVTDLSELHRCQQNEGTSGRPIPVVDKHAIFFHRPHSGLGRTRLLQT